MLNKHYKYILIGRGLSGSILSFKLRALGISHLIIDQPKLSRSSRIAAGLVNPVVLKRLKAVHHAAHFIEEALPFYNLVEQETKSHFLHQIPVQHILRSQEEQNNWHTRSVHPSLSSFLKPDLLHPNLTHISTPFGLGEVQHSFWVDTTRFLQVHEERFGSQIIHALVKANDVDIANKTLKLQEGTLSFEHLVDCSGHLAKSMYPALDAIFTPTRGEVLVIKASELDETQLLHAGVFILPLGNQYFKVGATYHWDTLEDKPTVEGKEKLISELEKIYSGPYQIVEHLAGVRPNVKDRKPLLGSLNEQTYLFNGMGSRAVLMAPHLADLMLAYMEQGEPLPTEYNLNRFPIS